MYEVNLHATLPSVQNVTVFLWRKVRGCSSVGMLVLENLHYTKASDNCWLMRRMHLKWKERKPTGKRNGLRGKSSALVSAGIVRKPFQVRALSGADHLASVSNGFNTRCWETRCVGQHVTSSLNLDNCAFVSSTRALVHEAVQKWNQSTGSTGLFNLLSSNSFVFDRLLFGIFVIFTAKSPSLQMLWGKRQEVLWVKLTAFLILLLDCLDLFAAFECSCL